MDYDDPVCRQMHVELEAVRLGGHPQIERRDRIFRPEIAPAAVRKDLRAGGIEERHNPEC
jgi:hypothetical protein